LRREVEALTRLHGACSADSETTTPVADAGSRGEGPLARVDGLTVVVSRIAATAGPDSLSDPAHALQVLQLLTFRQGNGREEASAASLYDLTRLASRALAVTEFRLPVPADPLGRVRRAIAVDQLSTARAQWSSAGGLLAPPVRSLTRAPRLYQEGLAALAAALPPPRGVTDVSWGGGAVPGRREPSFVIVDPPAGEHHGLDPDDLAVQVVAALPGLAVDAADALARLTRTSGLVTPTRPLGRLGAHWVQMSDERACQAHRHLRSAATASSAAATAVTTSVRAMQASAAAAKRTSDHVAQSYATREVPAPQPADVPHDHLPPRVEGTAEHTAPDAGRPNGWPPAGPPGSPATPPTGPPAGPPGRPAGPGRPPARPRPRPRLDTPTADDHRDGASWPLRVSS
jgi:hypothetical protein